MTWADAKAWFFDWLNERAEPEFGPRRQKLLADARGRVLEIGAGTGMNIGHYPDGIELVLLEPNEAFLRRLGKRLDQSGREATVVTAYGESLPFDDASFDTVVLSTVLCSVADPARVLAEARRVLRPDGVLLFAEHIRSDDPRLARWQDRLNRPWRVIADGCNCNRPTLATIESSPFVIQELERSVLPKSPPLVRPFIAGRAAPR